MADEKLTLDQVFQKTEEGEIKGPYNFRATFDNVLNGDGTTLEQFFKDYMDFMKESFFLHVGGQAPVNNHFGLWIDTNETNADQIGLKS